MTMTAHIVDPWQSLKALLWQDHTPRPPDPVDPRTHQRLDDLERLLHQTMTTLTQEQEYGKQQGRTIGDLRSTVESYQRMAAQNTTDLMALMDANGALKEACRRLEDDHKLDQETIALMRERMHTMEAEMALLRDERIKLIGTNQVWQLRAESYKARLLARGETVDE